MRGSFGGSIHDCRKRTVAANLAKVMAIVWLGAAAWPAAPSYGQVRRSELWVPGRLLVQPKGGVSAGQLNEVFRRHGAKRLRRLSHLKLTVLQVPEDRLAAVEAALKADPRINFVERDRLVAPALAAADPYVSREYHLTRMRCPTAWEKTTGSAAAPIAILDSGVDAGHPDLAGKLVAGYNVFDGNDDTRDVSGHGTMVAGAAAAASNNDVGIASVAWRNPIMPIRVTDTDGYGYISTLAAGLVWAADHGARIANMSFGIFGADSLSAAAQYFESKGGVVFAAAGNDGLAHADPANPWIISVGATDENDQRASFSSSGAYVDLTAPGVNITTTGRGGQYVTASGTSLSCPLAAGVAGLLYGVNPSLTPAQVEELLEANARDLGAPGYDPVFGWGRVDAANAVGAAALIQNPPDTTRPAVAISAPGGGALVHDTVSVEVEASDDTTVARVMLFADGRLVGVTTSAPYRFAWDVRSLLLGRHTLLAVAYDTSSNWTASDALVVTVVDPAPPQVQFAAPTAGSTISGEVEIEVSANDNGAITRVEIFADGALLTAGSNAPYVAHWATASVANGSHTLLARMYSCAGNSGTSIIPVVVRNAPPSVHITAPRDHSVYRQAGVITLRAEVIGNASIARVEFEVDSHLHASDSYAPYTVNLDLATLGRGRRLIRARAIDAAGNVRASPRLRIYTTF
jgi:subtilisin family serine protease